MDRTNNYTRAMNQQSQRSPEKTEVNQQNLPKLEQVEKAKQVAKNLNQDIIKKPGSRAGGDVSKMFAKPSRTPSLNLSGKDFTKDIVFSYPEFSILKEKDKTFSELVNLTQSPSFQTEYSDFLSSLSSEKWFEINSENPKKMAQFAIIAFLDQKIDREEMFIINIVAEAYWELQQNNHDIGAVVGVAPKTLSSENIGKYLAESGFPPFADNTNDYAITHRKTPTELEKIKTGFIEDFGKRSPVKRTVLEYTISHFLDNLYGEDLSQEMLIYTQVKLGFREVIQKKQGTMVLLSPELQIELLRQTSSNPSHSSQEHSITFGYSEDNSKFYEGVRAISIPSPALEPLPNVHSTKKGPKGLGVLFHDLNYHIPLEINNPYLSTFTRIANELKTQSSNPLLTDEFQKFTLVMAKKMVDRELDFRRNPPERTFWNNLYWQSRGQWRDIFGSKVDYIKWYNEVFLPIINKSLNETQDPTTVEKIQSQFFDIQPFA